MTDTPALKIVYRDPAKLKGYAKNARTHSPEQIAQIRRSIDEWGFTNPILLRDDGVQIGAGHGRQAAALLDPPIKRVPTIIIPGLTPDQWRAYVLADNRIALGSGWDADLLRRELTDLGDLGIDLSLTGFLASELADFEIPGFAADPLADEGPRASLMDRFGVAPFSVLNAREGWWQARKSAWLALGIKSEVGRGENLLKMSDTVLEPDPVKRAARKARQEATDVQG